MIWEVADFANKRELLFLEILSVNTQVNSLISHICKSGL